MKRKHIVGALTVGAIAAGAVASATPRGRAFIRQVLRRVSRRARYQSGRIEGLRYRVAGRHPDPSAGGPLLADRVRSVLGPLEHRLDVPRVHVMAVGHRVLLHGDLATESQVRELVGTVREVPGVDQVESHLQVGFYRGESRPSEGHWHHAPSPALSTLLAAAHGGGIGEGAERDTVHTILTAFLALLPQGERRHVLSHLPADLRALATPVKFARLGRRRPRHRQAFMEAALPDIPAAHRDAVVESVLGALRSLVPEETVDVAAVLPQDLRHLWKVAVPL